MKRIFTALITGLLFSILSCSSSADWCETKASIGQITYEDRDIVTVDEVLSSVEDAWKRGRKDGVEVIPRYMLVDVKRMIRDIYRTDKKDRFVSNYDDPKDLYDRELYQCMVNRY